MESIQEFLKQEDLIKKCATTIVDYAILKGLVMRTRAKPDSSENLQPAPFTLVPSPVPKRLFEQALAVQQDFNFLMHAISQDIEFLKSAYSSVLQTDEFTRKLFEIYETTRKENPRKTELSIVRSDYMFNRASDGIHSLKQVEINMIASSFGGIGTEKMVDIHRTTMKQNGFGNVADSIPENNALSNIADGLITAWKSYMNENAAIVFIITDEEQNIFDQRCLEFRINEINPSIRVERYTFSDVAACGRLDTNGCLFIGNNEVAVVYYRAGYVPKNYPSQKEWDARLMLDRSNAINCPSAGHQLVGAKKLQQVLAQPGIVEKFIKDPEAVKRIRETFVAFHGLEMDKQGDSAVALAMEKSDDFVLKPQLEGGGNNLYRKDMVAKLNEVGKDERRCSYILMEKIRPMPVTTVILRSGAGSEQFKTVEGVSELGVFGVVIASGDKIIQNSCAGHLLRTKASYHEDGGVAAGVAVLDSPLLF